MYTKSVQVRRKKLFRNFRLMFFLQAFLSVRTLNVVASLFYLARGISLAQIFYLSILWAVINMLSEVPSSYLADRWGRNKTIILSSVLYGINCVLVIFSHSFAMFALSIVVFALSYACFSGTDEALVYDTSRELGETKNSLLRLGRYSAAEKIFKIVTPIVGVLIAKDLSEHQFIILLTIDSLAALCALIISLFIVEPQQHFEVEKVEAGVFKDAVQLIKTNPNLVKAICNRAFAFTSIFIIWRYHQQVFVSIGTPILALGIGWSLFNLIVTIINYQIHRLWPSKSLTTKINYLNFITIFFVVLFLIGWYFKINFYILLTLFFVINMAENARWPIFSDLFNKYSNSFNRATTLSLSNLVKSIGDIPLLAVAGLLVTRGLIYPVYFLLAVITLSSIIFYLPKKIKFENKY